MSSRHGTLPWEKLVAPAMNLARNGFEVNIDLAAALQGYDFITEDAVWAESYAPYGTVLVEGDICYRKVSFLYSHKLTSLMDLYAAEIRQHSRKDRQARRRCSVPRRNCCQHCFDGISKQRYLDHCRSGQLYRHRSPAS